MIALGSMVDENSGNIGVSMLLHVRVTVTALVTTSVLWTTLDCLWYERGLAMTLLVNLSAMRTKGHIFCELGDCKKFNSQDTRLIRGETK